MKNWISAFIIAGILIVLGFFIGKSCSDKEVIVQTNFPEEIAKIDKNIKALQDSIEAIKQQRILHQTFNKYEITKIDSLISIDSAWVNAIIRARIQRLSQLSGFFDIGTNDGGTDDKLEGSTGW